MCNHDDTIHSCIINIGLFETNIVVNSKFEPSIFISFVIFYVRNPENFSSHVNEFASPPTLQKNRSCRPWNSLHLSLCPLSWI